LKRNRQKPDKKGTQWLKSGDFHIFLDIFKTKSPCQLHTTCVFFHLAGWHIFSPRTVAGSPQDQCPHNGAQSERTTETFGRAAAKANGNLLPQIPRDSTDSTKTEHEFRMKNQIRTFFNS